MGLEISGGRNLSPQSRKNSSQHFVTSSLSAGADQFDAGPDTPYALPDQTVRRARVLKTPQSTASEKNQRRGIRWGGTIAALSR